MKYINTVLVDLSILGMAYEGANGDGRFLDLYQFTMWGFVLLAMIALLLPSKDLFKEDNNNPVINFFNWCFSIIKVLVSVWVGMSVLAAFYLVVTILRHGKKAAYFNEIKST